MTDLFTKDHSVSDRGADSRLFEKIARDLLGRGMSVRFRAQGGSMSPAIRDGEIVEVTPVIVSKLRKDDIVLAKSNHGFRLHRIVLADQARDVFITRGDCGQDDDPALTATQILGLARAKEVRVGRRVVKANFRGVGGWSLGCAARAQRALTRILRGASVRLLRASTHRMLLLILIFLCVASCGFAQVVFKGASTPVTAELPPGTDTVTFSQTIPAQSNGLLVISISMNNQQSQTSAVTAITDNGSPLGIFPVGTVATSPAKSRVEIWALKAPPIGLNTIRITIPVTAPTVGVVAASADFANVNQTTPFETFGSSTGAGNGSSPTVTVTSAINEAVIDTVATAPANSLTVGSGQTQLWQTSSGGGSTDTEGAGSIKGGSAPTATMTWTHTGSATWAIGAVSIRPATVTGVKLRSLVAYSGSDKEGSNRVLVTWETAGEAHNLGFNVYREENGNRVRINSSIIAGSALLMRGALPKHAGRSYSWIDPSVQTPGASYWLEDIDVNGARTMHGPVTIQAGAQLQPASDTSVSETRMLSQLRQAQPTNMGTETSHFVEGVAASLDPTPTRLQTQFELAAHPAVKISVEREGWYSVAQPDLVKAGLDPSVDPATLHLYAEAVEQPMQITGATIGRGGFGRQAAIHFYGVGINTVFSGTRVYWLVDGKGVGTRIPRLRLSAGSNQPPSNFLSKVVLEQHTIYFAALLTSDDKNFFGALVSPTAVEQILATPNPDSSSTESASLEVVLQGIIVGYPHDVEIALNGTTLGNMSFTGQDKGRMRMTIPPGLLQNGSNTVTLAAQNGDYDTSLVQSIAIEYPHMYVADSDLLKFTGRAGDELSVSGFSSAPTVLDVTDPNRPLQVTGQVTSRNGVYSIALQVPWRTTNMMQPERHTLFAVANHRISSPTALVANHPSNWHSSRNAGDIAMITNPDFASALMPLVKTHREQGKSSAVIPTDELYDEFNFGESSPFAIREFLKTATENWKKAPAYLLLNGRASYDPRNYLGLGNLDLVPTRILPSPSLMTASDDWFSDFDETGMPTIATGRLPVSSLQEASTVVSKIVAYEGQSSNGPWTSQALMVADANDMDNFSQYSQEVQSLLPKSMQATDVFTSTVGAAAAQQEIISGINSGQLIVNYIGHGSEEQWSGSDIFDTNSVSSLTNGSQLPVFLTMDCLNGFFQDPYAQSLGAVLLLAPNGGAVAVLASTGLNDAVPQVKLDALVIQNALNAARPTLGESILRAKSHLGDPPVRRTYLLFGDPAMQMKQPHATPATH